MAVEFIEVYERQNAYILSQERFSSLSIFLFRSFPQLMAEAAPPTSAALTTLPYALSALPNATAYGANASLEPAWYEPAYERDPPHIIIPLSVMYVIVFVFGLLGNISTCIVIGRNRQMRTATNFYLFSLACSDLLLLISGLPLELHKIWFPYPYPFNEATCVIQG